MPEISRQADYYGLPTPDRDPAPPPEKVADLLKAPTPWEGPMKVAGHVSDEHGRDHHTDHLDEPSADVAPSGEDWTPENEEKGWLDHYNRDPGGAQQALGSEPAGKGGYYDHNEPWEPA